MVDKLRETGVKMQSIGCLMTILFTVPLLLSISFGRPGFVVGVIIGLAVLGTALRKR